MFNGRFNKELFSSYQRWLPDIKDLYLPCCDSETGDFRFLPFPGSLIDQPYLTMNVLKVIQNVYRKVQAEKVKKITGGKKYHR